MLMLWSLPSILFGNPLTPCELPWLSLLEDEIPCAETLENCKNSQHDGSIQTPALRDLTKL